MVTFLGRLCPKAKPKYVICDKGGQFWCAGLKAWCRRRKIRPDLGAVGRSGSIAAIECSIRTLKDEGLRRIVVPLRECTLRMEIDRRTACSSERRPNTALAGKTPDEAYPRIAPANRRPRWDRRKRWPCGASCAKPETKACAFRRP